MSAFMADLVFQTSTEPAPRTETVHVTIDGKRYTAREPQKHVMEELSASMSSTASVLDQAHAMIQLLKDSFVDEDWIRLKARMEDRADSLRSYAQLIPALLGICEYFGADTSEWAIAQQVPAELHQPGYPQQYNAPYPPHQQHQQVPDLGRPMRNFPPPAAGR